jgi:two-component sensor histidine kinase
MSKMHEQLHQAEDLHNINMRDYITSIVQTVHDTYQREGTAVGLNLDIEDFHLDMDASFPIGLIVNELVSNSFKHAFLNRESGRIDVSLKRLDNGAARLQIRDNGNGMADEESLLKSPSLGFSLVRALADQVSGTLEISGTNGFSTSITFHFNPDGD